MTKPSTKGIIDMLAKGFEMLAEGTANIFCGVERKSNSLLKKERTFDEFLKEVFDGDYRIGLYFEKDRYDFKICFDPSKWAEIQNFYDKECHIDECFLIVDGRNGYLMKDVFIKNINYVPHLKRFEVTYVPKTVEVSEDEKWKFDIKVEDGVYIVEADWLVQVFGMIDVEDEEDLGYFQRVLRSSGIIDKLEEMGIEEGDTVSILNFDFDYIR